MTETDMGPRWAKAWTNPTGDAVFHNRDKGLIRFDFKEEGCLGHDVGSFCGICLSRIELAMRAARHVLAGKKPPEA